MSKQYKAGSIQKALDVDIDWKIVGAGGDLTIHFLPLHARKKLAHSIKSSIKKQLVSGLPKKREPVVDYDPEFTDGFNHAIDATTSVITDILGDSDEN